MNERSDNYASGNGGPASSLQDRVRSLRLPDRRPPSGGSSKLAWFSCLLFAGALGFVAYREHQGQALFAPPGQAADKPADSAVAPSPTSEKGAGRPAEAPPIRNDLDAGGYIVPVRRVQVSPKVGGEVRELFIEEGQFVKKGTILAKLERTRYEFEFRRADALTGQALAEYDRLRNGNRLEEKVQAEAALREAEKMRDQLRDEVGRLRRARFASTDEELVRVESRLVQADYKCRQLEQSHKMTLDGPRREDVEKARQAYEHAKAQRDSAKYDLDNTDVVAPVDGIILAKRAEVGNTVRPEAFSNGLSASLCDMADLKEMEVDVDISERELPRVAVGQRCEIRTEAFPDKVYVGTVSRLMPESNRAKASVSTRVRIDVPENDRQLRPEMRARVVFLSTSRK